MAWASGWSRGGLALVVLCLAVYLPGLWSIPPVDRDECRFAQASRQMFEAAALPASEQNPALHSGGWAIPYYGDKPRLNKPPLIYWLQVASAWTITGGHPRDDAIWMYRLPSVFAAMIVVLATWRLGLGMFDPRAAWLGAVLLAVCPIMAWESHQARADMVLLACCTVMQLALWRTYKRLPAALPLFSSATSTQAPPTATFATSREKSQTLWSSWGLPIVFWLALTAGIMTKGPIAPLVAVATILSLCIVTRHWRWLARLRPLVGLLILIAGVTPWVVLVAKQIGFAAYMEILNKEVVQRSTVGSQEGHWGPPGFHTALLFALFFPGSLMVVDGLIRAWRRAWPTRAAGGVRTSPRGAELFLLAWIVPTWLVFEIVTSKLAHYTLPMYPAVALLAARHAMGLLRGGTPWKAWTWLQHVAVGVWGLTSIFLVHGAAFVLTIFMIMRSNGLLSGSWLMLIGGSALVLIAVGLVGYGLVLMRRGWVAQALVVTATALALLYVPLFLILAPRFAPGVESSIIMEQVRELDPKGTLPVVTMHKQDSMMFWTRGTAVRTGRDGVRSRVAEGRPAVFVLGEPDPFVLKDEIAKRWPRSTSAVANVDVPFRGSSWLIVAPATPGSPAP